MRDFDGLRDFPIARPAGPAWPTGSAGSAGLADPADSAGRGRVLSLSAALAVVAIVAVAFGGYALMRSPGGMGSGKNALPGLPPPVVMKASAPASPSPGTRKAASRRRRRSPRTGQTTAPQQPNRPAMPAAAPQPTRRARKASPTVSVNYLVASQGPSGFQGEVRVVNNTARAITAWELVVALPEDNVVSFTNAAGYVSNGILLLGPANAAQEVPPDGGTLDVFFVAEGPQTNPDACTFNGINCGS